MNIRTVIAALLTLALVALSGCGAKEGSAPAPEENAKGSETKPSEDASAGGPSSDGLETGSSGPGEPGSSDPGDSEAPEPLIGGCAMIPNPLSEYDTIEAAQEAAGFEIRLPEAPEGADRSVYRVMNGGSKMLEVIWYAGSEELLRMRKAPGAEKIDGDYNVYSMTSCAEYPFAEVELRMEDGRAHVISWTQKEDGSDYSYAVLSGAGLSCGMDGSPSEADAIICALAGYDAPAGYEASAGRDPSESSKAPADNDPSEDYVLPGYAGLKTKSGAELPGDIELRAEQSRPHSQSTLIVSVAEDFSEDQLSALLEKYGLSVIYDYRNFRMYALSAGRDLEDKELFSLIEALEEEDGVLGAEPDYIIELTDPIEPVKETV